MATISRPEAKANSFSSTFDTGFSTGDVSFKPAIDIGLQTIAKLPAVAADPKNAAKTLEKRTTPAEYRAEAYKSTLRAIGHAIAIMLVAAAFITSAVLICTLLSNPFVIGFALTGLAVAALTVGLVMNTCLCAKCVLHTSAAIAQKNLAKNKA